MMTDNVNPYALLGVLIASTNADGSAYGTPIELYKDQMFTVTPVHDTDQQRDSGAVTSSLSIMTHAEVTIQAGGVPIVAFQIMLGANSSTSAAAGKVRTRRKAKVNRPYFGAIGYANTEDGRIAVIGLHKCQIQGDPEMNFDGTTNAWITSEMSALALAVDDDVDVWDIYDSLEDWVADMPSDGTEFLAWMTA